MEAGCKAHPHNQSPMFPWICEQAPSLGSCLQRKQPVKPRMCHLCVIFGAFLLDLDGYWNRNGKKRETQRYAAQAILLMLSPISIYNVNCVCVCLYMCIYIDIWIMLSSKFSVELESRALSWCMLSNCLSSALIRALLFISRWSACCVSVRLTQGHAVSCLAAFSLVPFLILFPSKVCSMQPRLVLF